MTAYRRGDYHEKRVKADLEGNGYVCWQSRGSKTVADVVAVKPRQLVLVQVKSGAARVSGDEWNELYALAARLDAVPLCVQHVARGRIVYWRLVGSHNARSRAWLYVNWTPDELAG